MITEQIVKYIKDQLASGKPRERVKNNLLSAGWTQEDVDQAFSFAEPVKNLQTINIAPTFAVENQTAKPEPVDKASILNQEDTFIPVLKKDNEVLGAYKPPFQPPVQNNFEQPVSPVVPNIPAISITPPIMPIQQTFTPQENVVTDRQINVSSTPKKKHTLAFVTIILLLLAVLGNGYLWLVVDPNLNQENQELIQQNVDDLVQVEKPVTETEDIIVTPVDTNTQNEVTVAENDILLLGSVLQNFAGQYFDKYNAYGNTAMSLGSCNASGTVFADTNVKKTLDDIFAITKTPGKCALFTDTSNLNRSVSYMVYIPIKQGEGYCLDSTGAALLLTQEPTGEKCVML